MAVKTCCINTCNSSSNRPEDKGVTYLRFPKDPTLRGLWYTATRRTDSEQAQPSYVCSRHFCKNDFEKHDSKYVLKSDAVPSIFSWIFEEEVKTDETEMESKTALEPSVEPENEVEETLNSSKESVPENLESIRDFILAQEQEIIDAKAEKLSEIISETTENQNTAEFDGNISPVIGNIREVIETVENVQKAAKNIDQVSTEVDIAQIENENIQTPDISQIDSQELFLGFENPEKNKTDSKEKTNIEHDIKIDTQDIKVEEDTVNEVKDSINIAESSVNVTENTVNVTDSNVNVTDSNVNVTDNNVNVTDSNVNVTDNTVNVTDTSVNVTDTSVNITDTSVNIPDTSVNIPDTIANVKTDPITVKEEDTLAVAANVMDMILSETEAKLSADNSQENKQERSPTKKMGTGEKGNTMSLSVGSKVEARDFGDDWHPAEILEVDFEEMEVLVHYDPLSKKIVRPDEWISVSSPRLRPQGSGPLKAPTPTPPPEVKPETPEPPEPPVIVKEEVKQEEKQKKSFEVGERCFARWKDNRRFAATISADLGEGLYEIVFDDGARWSCNTSRIYKTKETSHLDTSLPLYTPPSSTAALSSNSAPAVPFPLYNTHLFDPTRDYLGSKSERREKKRKLNIKEIFNIGQKKQKKMDVTPRASKPRPPPKERKARVVKKIEMPTKEIKQEESQPATKEVTASQPTEVVMTIPKEEVVDVTGEQKVDQVVVPKTETQEAADLSPEKIIPEAVASIIGTNVEDEIKDEINLENPELDESYESECKMEDNLEVVSVDIDVKMDVDIDINSETLSAPESQAMKEEEDGDNGLDEKVKLEKFDHQDSSQSGEVIDRIKEVINKLEDNLSEISTKSDIIKHIESPKVVIKEDDIILADLKPSEDKLKNLAKVKKGKKLRLLQEKKVKKQVEKVKCELEVMKKQMEDMKKAMLLKTEEIAMGKSGVEMPESFLLPGEWCCKWVNGQPVGTVSEIEGDVRVGIDNKPALPRRSVQVEDKRLPPGWTKHMVRRSYGSSAGKWDVVLVSPENRRFHTKTEMRHHFEHNPEKVDALKDYQLGLFDFGVHLKLSRRMGWYTTTPDGRQETPTLTLPALPAGTLETTSPLVKRKKLSLTKKDRRERDRLRREERREIDRERHRKNALSKAALLKAYANYPAVPETPSTSGALLDALQTPGTEPVAVLPVSPILPVSGPSSLLPPQPPLEGGCVYVGTLKVQIIMNLLRCPAEGCYKNFRNNTLLKMHIKHYHRELIKCLGATPKVLDLAYARNKPPIEAKMLKLEGKRKTKVKLPRPPKRFLPETQTKDTNIQQVTPVKTDPTKLKRLQDSPKLRQALGTKIRRPKVLLPVRKLEQSFEQQDQNVEESTPLTQEPIMPPLDFETAISTHTVTKPLGMKLNRKSLASVSKRTSDDDWMASDPDTRSSNPRSGTPDINIMDPKFVSSESNEGQNHVVDYTYTETGEKIKIEHMKREEIINCHCGFREEDGLMVQCELCLCWQHATCHNIQREADVPEKYTCSICLNPRRGRRSQRFLHDQDRLYEGLLPGAKPCESLRRSHELSGNLLRIQDALHALRVKYHVATKKDHPKLYLWAKDWEATELNMTQEKLNSDYSDLNIMINSIGKENLPLKDDIKDMQIDIKTPPFEDTEIDRLSQKDSQIGPQSLLSGLLSSPGGASLDLPISTLELERLAKTVQEEAQHVIAPQPEAAIENSACKERLLRHLQRCQALVDARLDSIEAQVAELESQDPSFEDDETADFFPRTKQTVTMLMRDLDTMEELGVIT